MDGFTKGLDEHYAGLASNIRKTVLTEDGAVEETTGPFMNAKAALCYLQAGVMKYALTSTARGLSFHSMVMYSNPAVFKFAQQRLTGVKMQKGCFGVPAPEAFHMDEFKEFIRFSAQQDFQPVIDHYAKMAKRKKTSTQ